MGRFQLHLLFSRSGLHLPILNEETGIILVFR